jgi:hypothetical protein
VGVVVPLAAPAYILAYTYMDLLEYYGPVQSILRQWFGWKNAQDYWSQCSIDGSDRNVYFGALSLCLFTARSAFQINHPLH